MRRGPAKRRSRSSRAAEAKRRLKRFVVVTGLSGAGKSHAIRALEDLGYFCVDNLPTELIPTLAALTIRGETDFERVAIVVDARERDRLQKFPGVFRRLRGMPGIDARLIFLEATRATLMRRFSETRRPHPLARDRSAAEGIDEERRKMQAIRRMADLTLDTSSLTVHELRDVLTRLERADTPRAEMVVDLMSFGFKHGAPVEADLVFDVRCLPNPHFVDRLRPLTGRDAAVVRFMRRHPATGEFIEQLTSFLRFALPRYVEEGKSYLTVAVGCTGGQHRSVMVVGALRRALAGVPGVRLRVRHRDA